MKTATLLFLALLATGASAEAPVAPAQDGKSAASGCMHGGHGRHHGGKGRHLQRMQETLGLDDAQRARVETVFRAQHEKARAGMEARKQAMHTELRGELAGILTPEQLAKFDEMHAQRMQKRAEWRAKRQARQEGTTAQ